MTTEPLIKLCALCGSLALIESSEHSTTIRCMDENCGVKLTRFRFAVGQHRPAAIFAWNRRVVIPTDEETP